MGKPKQEEFKCEQCGCDIGHDSEDAEKLQVVGYLYFCIPCAKMAIRQKQIAEVTW